jgi:myo-inositol-1(or 4)-monophosphatase
VTEHSRLVELSETAAEILTAASARFREGLGAPSAVAKGPTDFATNLDLELERTISAALRERTGIDVHGEEFGGPDLHSGTSWVLDPIDGTLNYSAGLPLAGILLALIEDGVPVIGLTWLPLLGRTFAAVEGDPLLEQGEPAAPLTPTTLSASLVSIGPLNPDSRVGPFRQRLFTEISRKASRVRMFGSTGFELAYVAAGVLGAAIVFGHHAWDNSAGAALVRAAGGVVTDLEGNPWTIDSRGVLAAAPGVHQQVLDILNSSRG